MERHLNFWGAALIVFLFDRLTKYFVIQKVSVGESISFGLFSITHIYNTGTAFGLFKNASWFFILFSIAVIVFLIATYYKYSSPLLFGLVLGAALGNLVDRVLYGAVIDFFDLGFWPVFNVADAVISIIIIALIVQETVLKKHKI